MAIPCQSRVGSGMSMMMLGGWAASSTALSGADEGRVEYPLRVCSVQSCSAEVKENSRRIKYDECDRRGGAEGGAAAVCVCDVCVCDGGAVWAGGYGGDERAGAGAGLHALAAVFLVHSGFAGGGGADYGDACRGRILPVGAGGVWGLLGISSGVVELERFVAAGGGLRGAGDGLPELLFSGDCGLEASCGERADRRGERVDQCARHPDGRDSVHGDVGIRAGGGGGALRGCGDEVAAQSVHADGAAACSAVPGVGGGAGAGIVALFGVRASVQRGGGSGESATELSDCAGDRGAAFRRDLFFADDVFAGGAGRLAEMAYRVFFRCGPADWRTMAGICDDHRGAHHQSFAVERDGADEHAHAVDNGRGWIPAGGAFGAASAVWHAVDRDHRVVDYLRAAGAEDDGAAADCLCVVADWGDGADSAFVVAIARDAAGFGTAIPDSMGAGGNALRDLCAAGNERGGAGGERSVCAEVGAGAAGAGAGGVFCTAHDTEGKHERKDLTQRAQRAQRTQRRNKG